MKKIIMTLTFVLSATAFSAEVPSMTFDTLILKKSNIDKAGVFYIPNRHVSLWCANLGSPMNVMSLEVAETLEKLSEGLYTCSGKFVQVSIDRMAPIQIFQIDTCSAVDATELRTASCKVIK